MLRRTLVHALTPVALVVLLTGLLAHRAAAAAGERCFPEAAPAITSCIDPQFTAYWERNGGLAVFGYPITAAQPERSPESGASYLTQYFERQRMEYHPENQPPYNILLGRLGVAQLEAAGQDWQSQPQAAPDTPGYMPATGHAIAPEFLAYWRAHGLDLDDPGISERESLALFGYPVTEPAVETNSSGDTVLTQYFERARLEHHIAAGVHQVLQGRLGSEVHAQAPAASPTPTAQPTADAEPAPLAPTATPIADEPTESDAPRPSEPKEPEPEAPRRPSATPTPAPAEPTAQPAPATATPAPPPASYPAPEPPTGYPAPAPPKATPAPTPAPSTPSYPAP